LPRQTADGVVNWALNTPIYTTLLASFYQYN